MSPIVLFCHNEHGCNSSSIIKLEFQAEGDSLVAQMIKESACNAGDPGSIPESRRSMGEGNGNPIQYS